MERQYLLTISINEVLLKLNRNQVLNWPWNMSQQMNPKLSHVFIFPDFQKVSVLDVGKPTLATIVSFEF